MMGGGGELKSSLMMWSGTADSKNMMSSLMPCAVEEQAQAGVSTNKMPHPLSSSSSVFHPQHQQHLRIPSSTGGLLGLAEVNGGTATSLPSDLHDDAGQESSMAESWSQLLLRGLVGDHERYSVATALLSKGLDEGPLPQAYNFYDGHGSEEIQTNKPQAAVSHMLLASSSPRSCVTTSVGGSNMLDFSNSTPPAPDQLKNQSDNSSESNSNATGSAPKKARVQTSSSAQSTLKVRKERLGDRITALHQIVSPFGKTDTASVLQETIGYIRFLLSQIEALSYPYLGHVGAAGNADSMQQYQQTALLNHGPEGNGTAGAAGQTDEQQDAKNNGGDEANKKDLRSRGLCLVPVSCTSHLADDNSASDFWAVAAAPPPPAPLGGGIMWR